MNNECVLRCEENYEYTTEGDEYVCKAKDCNDRTPFSNGSCSLKEDFVQNGNPVKCYLYKEIGKSGNMCINQCPSDLVQVFLFFYLLLVITVYVFFILRLIILLVMKVNLIGLAVTFAPLSCLK
jgi:hypothetical protein